MTKKICTVCKGNGFVRVPYEISREEVWANCDFCKSQGEIDESTLDTIIVDADGLHRLQ